MAKGGALLKKRMSPKKQFTTPRESGQDTAFSKIYRGDTMKPALTFFSVLLMAAGLAAADAKSYSIKFDRPVHAGEKYRISILAKDVIDMNFTDGTNSKKSKEDVVTRFDALMSVVEVNKKGYVQNAAYVVEKFTIETAKGKKEILPAGKQIGVSFSGKKVRYMIDGDPVDDGTAKFLSKILTFFKPEMEDDAVFGTKDRKKIGDCWDMNYSLAAERFNRDDIQLAKKDLTGSTCLKGVQKADGRDCLRIGIKLKAGAFKMKNIKMESSSLDAYMDLLYPVDEQRTAVEVGMSVAVKFRGRGKVRSDSPEMLMDLNMLLNQKMRVTRLK